jgi:hypothetical protein
MKLDRIENDVFILTREVSTAITASDVLRDPKSWGDLAFFIENVLMDKDAKEEGK